MRSNHVLTSILFLSVAGCSLIKVNGKPIGGGSSSSTSNDSEAPASSASSSSSSNSDPCAGRHEDYWTCQEQVSKERNKPREEALGKRPAFCEALHIPPRESVDLEAFQKVMEPDRDDARDAEAFANVMCSVDGQHLELRPKVMEIRARWMKLRGMDEKDFVAAVGLNSRYGEDKQDTETLGPALAQMHTTNDDDARLDQLGASVSMMGRVAHVRDCLRNWEERPIAYIVCAREPLDVAKALAEIDAAPGINGTTRYSLRRLTRQVTADQTKLNAALSQLAKSEPAVGKLIAIADKERAEWTKPTAARAKLVTLVEGMEQATASKKRSAFTGCDASTYSAWEDTVRASELPAVSTKYLEDTMRRAVFTRPEAYLAFRALELCLAGLSAEGRFDNNISSSVVRRGWRSSTVAAWYAASGDIKFDSRDLSLDMVIGRGGAESQRGGDAESGTIEKLTKEGANVIVDFKQTSETYEDCIAWVPTKQIRNIDSSGNVYYVNKCTKTGMVTYDRTPNSVHIHPLLATGLKPGMRLYMYGAPIAATASAKSSKPVWLFGVSLK